MNDVWSVIVFDQWMMFDQWLCLISEWCVISDCVWSVSDVWSVIVFDQWVIGDQWLCLISYWCVSTHTYTNLHYPWSSLLFHPVPRQLVPVPGWGYLTSSVTGHEWSDSWHTMYDRYQWWEVCQWSWLWSCRPVVVAVLWATDTGSWC